ncbi:MAG: phosphotransferase [Candidatus Riflebacteria bacterium]|nr:phosphotransferase [Candidatus Riflebacteria bacterium]
MSYRVLIPTAGTGSRLGKLTQFVNKSLVSIANRPAISHLIDLFPSDVEFVIALGFKGNLVREFLEIAYPQRKFFFVEIEPFEGPGSGLGLSILACKEFLQQPFVFISCDTLVKESIPNLDHNWMGFADLPDFEEYRTLEIESGKVKEICEKKSVKVRVQTHKPYIGLSGIRDYETFWKAMENGGSEAISVGESFGLRSLLRLGVVGHCFTWYDTGNLDALNKTREVFREVDEPNILEKANEAIWFVNGQVVKFSDDERFIANRVVRSRELQGFVPEVTSTKTHMYSYSKSEGKILSEIVTIPLFEQLLQHSKGFWKIHSLNETEKQKFKDICLRFYRNKTLDRVALFYKNFQKQDNAETINGFITPTLQKLLDSLDWNWLSDGTSGQFHGDFHFENILYNKNENKFIFLDWRQEFGGSLTNGDVYYDLAKLLHGLIICHELIAKDHYWISWNNSEVSFDFFRKQVLVDCEVLFYKWLEKNSFDVRKVRILTGLVFLNIASLHHFPYSLLLYALGKFLLFKESGFFKSIK